MSKRLKKIVKKSSLMDIIIRYGGEKVKFNLFEELIIDENRINEELKNQPSYYGFLCLLRTKLDRVKSDKKAELNKIKSDLFSKFKSKVDPSTNRVYSNDLAEAKVLSNKLYQNALSELHKAEEEFTIIDSCVQAFYQRATLIQSLSANVRREMDNS